MAELPEWGRQHIKMALSWCLGYLGADRFYDGQIGWGVLKLITLGAGGIWWLADAIYLTRKAGSKEKGASGQKEPDSGFGEGKHE